MGIPDIDAWEGEWTAFDEGCAFRNFFGKTLKEAFALFEQCALIYQEDLAYMREAPFKYYVRAYIYYLGSQRSRGDSDAANCFLGLIGIRLGDQPEWLGGSWAQIEPVLRKIADQQEEFYDADRTIYSDFGKRVEQLLDVRDAGGK